ncbi:kinesin [Trichosporon asahii var. asahii CBS 2479]|uniref:Kinesin n=1 Tax=Trichosporon asahii var. asahii (strain ATCC 90039 / CBS 2479 / JCM 2466 / KCTC 7840 / NBRC 103889/ NCYC 2677 / UAMH 7654) TaxID=1186058 RepID=J8TY23_TRIAS|nr:kinesin [Trichosporon asahii var. asahii CBS 2479]EJT52997.1 kinesin [Trichosporon asahii var. asahii CBS 2479]
MQPPATRLPRVGGSPTKASGIPKGIPKPVTRSALGAASTVAGEKRKVPESPKLPAKRSTSGPKLGKSTTGIKMSTRGAASFAPKRKASAPTLGKSTTSSITTRRGPVSEAAARRPASAAATRSTARPTTTTAAAATRPVRPATSLGGPSRTPSARTSAASRNGNVTPEDGRLDNLEKMLQMIHEEQTKMAALTATKEDLASVVLNAEDKERENRRALSNGSEEMEALRARHLRDMEEIERQLRTKERENRGLLSELSESSEELGRQRDIVRELRQQLADQSTQHMTLSAQLTASQAQNNALQIEVERATLAVSAMKAELEAGYQKAANAEELAALRIKEAQAECDRRVAEIEEELRTAETIRRKLHNQVQELKGNIRVFARVRPVLGREQYNPEGVAQITYGDERLAAETGQSQLEVRTKSESATGKEREQVLSFQFDKVFQPKDGQQAVFEEISMLAQSVLDGYNVCIFAYGQTGSGKSWTMEGGDTPETAGMIPRAIEMIFAVSAQLRDRGWKYTMEGTFLEVYNDVINDLLGSGQFDTKRHEIKIDKDNNMTVTDTVSLPLSNPQQVSTLLEKARSRRAVAATLMNERSSRSHSVFALKVRGYNPLTDESSQGILNLVDLAGSERLAQSGAGENKDRLKETININKSLSALADVIGALGQGQQGGHVPYRNSTLTRLLQTSLSGSSKTLMLCNLSPLAAHLGETVCSLRFATKVNTTPAGTAKRTLTKG